MIQHRSELYKLFSKPFCAVEIGVAEGNNSEDMLRWPNLQHLYMVDRWACMTSQQGDAGFSQDWHDHNYRRVLGRMQKYSGRFTILRGDSLNMAEHIPDNSLDLVYIDGDHSLIGVRLDIAAWSPKVRWGGVMAFHDYENPAYGVKQAVHEFCDRVFEVHVLPEHKPEDAGCYFSLC